MSGRRVYFFNRFYRPDGSATAQILTDLCEGLARGGGCGGGNCALTVVTSRLNYDDPSIRYPAREQLDGIEVRRLWSTRFGRGNALGRLLDYLTIYLSFFVFMLREIGAADVAVFKTDPPLLSVPGAAGKALRGYRMVAWCQDVFPEVAMAELRLPRGAGWCLRWLQALRDWSLRSADRVVVLGTDMRAFLAGRGIPQAALATLSNWSVQADGDDDDGAARLRAEWGIGAGEFVVGYSGNLGRAHDWRTLLAAAEQLRDTPGPRFLCCGGGHGYGQLRQAVEERGLADRFLFLPYQERDRLAASLRVPDLHWFTLKERLTPFIFPSKFFGILHAGRPAVFIGDPGSEIAALIRAHGAGALVREGDADGLAAAIRHFQARPEAARAAGAAARQLWRQRYSREAEIGKWERLLAELLEQGEGARP